MKVLTSGEEDNERVSMLKQDISSIPTACEPHICYIPCDLFYCRIFNYENMPATMASTFCSFYKVSKLADLRYDGRFYGTRCHS